MKKVKNTTREKEQQARWDMESDSFHPESRLSNSSNTTTRATTALRPGNPTYPSSLGATSKGTQGWTNTQGDTQRREEREESKVVFIVTQTNDSRREVSEGITEPLDSDWQDILFRWSFHWFYLGGLIFSGLSFKRKDDERKKSHTEASETQLFRGTVHYTSPCLLC